MSKSSEAADAEGASSSSKDEIIKGLLNSRLDYYILYFQDCQLWMAKFMGINKHDLQVLYKESLFHKIRR